MGKICSVKEGSMIPSEMPYVRGKASYLHGRQTEPVKNQQKTKKQKNQKENPKCALCPRRCLKYSRPVEQHQTPGRQVAEPGKTRRM